MMYPFFSQNEGPSVDKSYPRSINMFFLGMMSLLRSDPVPDETGNISRFVALTYGRNSPAEVHARMPLPACPAVPFGKG